VFGALSYGMLCALVAFFFNSMASLLLNEEFGPKMGVLMLIAAAPVIEEVLKMFGVILLSGHKSFRGPLDGILFGFSIGAGFAMVENIFYISTKIPENSIELLMFRALYNTLAHGAFTAIGGAVLGKIKQDFKKPNLLLLMVPVLVAALTHTAFNVLAIVDIVGVSSLVLSYYIFSPAMVVALLIIVALLIFYNWNERKRKMNRELAELGVDANFDKEFGKLKKKANT
jgi:RsiW-degrading membrane proteinase PrsW (M82 family)